MEKSKQSQALKQSSNAHTLLMKVITKSFSLSSHYIIYFQIKICYWFPVVKFSSPPFSLV
jgi:hypothetical protein